jgi:sirohydrochlorin ferrochelatase
VLEAARAVKTGGPVEVSFLMGPEAPRRRFQDVVRKLESQRVASIVVVPMLVSSFSGHYDQIRWLAGEGVELDTVMQHHLHMAGIDRPDTRLPIHVTPAMDGAPEVARVIADRALALSTKPEERALFIVGHGPNSAEDYAAWMKNLRLIADSVRTWTGFRDVRVDVVRDDAPPAVRTEAVLRARELISLQHLVTQREVVVVPILVSKGAVSRDRIPADLAGLPVIYAGDPLLPHASIARWVEGRVRDATRSIP